MPLSEAARTAQRRLRYDCPFWASHCATILSEQKQPVRLIPRPWQARTKDTPAHVVPLDEAMELQREAGQPVRIIILKARKLGFSTWVQARFMQRVTQFPFQYALTAAHLRSSAGVLADMAQLMYDRLPTEQELGLGFNIKPQIVGRGTSRAGSRWLAFGDRKKPVEASVYETMTAGAVGGGRAHTPSLLHGSEVAHWDDPSFILGLLNAVPKIADTEVVLESTAKGFNDFHDRWVRAVEGAEDPETGGMYRPLFYGWQDNPRNALPFNSEMARARFESTIGDEDGGGDDEEPWLLETGVTLEQLRWRRLTRDEECGGKVELFHQEHPATPEQAFIGSGNPVFPGVLIARAIKDAEEAVTPVQGVLRGVDLKERRTRHATFLVPQRALWVPDRDISMDDRQLWGFTDRLLLWEHPVNERTQEGIPSNEVKPDGQYVVFVDVAQGADDETAGRDYSVIQVWDHVEKMQVARYRSRVPLHDLPMLAFLVAIYFNGAMLAPESTGLGVGVVDTLAQDLRYSPIYRRRRPGDDRVEGTSGTKLGWSTDLRSKPLMEQTMGQALKEGTHGIRDVATARQFTTYVQDEKGKHGAQKGSHDDLVMACMGAVRVANELRPKDPKKTRRRPPRGYDPITGYG